MKSYILFIHGSLDLLTNLVQIVICVNIYSRFEDDLINIITRMNMFIQSRHTKAEIIYIYK